MAYETIIYEKKGRIAYITLNRPEVLNALNSTMVQELGEAWQDLERDDEIWTAIVTGTGRALCAGIDVKMAAAEEGRAERVLGVGGEIRRWGPLCHDLAKPVICAANGICCGGGLDFVTESDIAICSEDAEFFDPHVSIGWVSGHEMVQLSRRIPFTATMRVALFGRHERMSAERAYQLGLVTEVVPRERLIPRATEIAELINENAPLAVRGTKLGLWKGLGLPLEQANLLTDGYLQRVAESEDHAEGPRAFAEKRKPLWKAR